MFSWSMSTMDPMLEEAEKVRGWWVAVFWARYWSYFNGLAGGSSYLNGLQQVSPIFGAAIAAMGGARSERRQTRKWGAFQSSSFQRTPCQSTIGIGPAKVTLKKHIATMEASRDLCILKGRGEWGLESALRELSRPGETASPALTEVHPTSRAIYRFYVGHLRLHLQMVALHALHSR